MSNKAANDYEATILARVLGKEDGQLPTAMAKDLLKAGFSLRDRERMHDLAIRNQEDALSADERKELFAYAKTGTVLSILKAKARRALKTRPQKSVSV